MRYILIFFTLLLLLSSTDLVIAQSFDPPLQIELVAEQKVIDMGSSTQVICVIHNTTPYTITDIEINSQGSVFKFENSTANPQNMLAPFNSTQYQYTLEATNDGSHNVIFTVSYQWLNPSSNIIQRHIDMVTTGIDVEKRIDFDWPAYLIPLFIGFAIGKFGSWLDTRWKQRDEDKKREKQAVGVALSVLQAARKGVESEENISFDVWEEAIVKGNLYPALHALGRRISKPELAKSLAELSITMNEYNERRNKNHLPDCYTQRLIRDLNDLIMILENVNYVEK
jgi:hypothetical protein